MAQAKGNGKFTALARAAMAEITARTKTAAPVPPSPQPGHYQTTDFAHQDFSQIDPHGEPMTIKDMASGRLPGDPEKE